MEVFMDALQKDKRYTYADYLTWDDDVRYELIDGVPYMMASPSTEHQRICSELHGQLWAFLQGKPCRPFTAPIDVRLNINKGDDTVFQPDIMVVCDHSKIDKKSINGAPDFVIEILSPSTSRHDTFIKLNKYLWAGVREYWVVNPDEKTVLAHILKDGDYIVKAYGVEDETISVSVLNGCIINLKEVFSQ